MQKLLSTGSILFQFHDLSELKKRYELRYIFQTFTTWKQNIVKS